MLLYLVFVHVSYFVAMFRLLIETTGKWKTVGVLVALPFTSEAVCVSCVGILLSTMSYALMLMVLAIIFKSPLLYLV